MINFVLVHIGSQLPSHFKYCVQQIRKTNPISPIYIITDTTNISISDNNTFLIPTSELQVPDIGEYYRYHPVGPLFRTSMLRLFYLESFLIKYKIQDIVHFDNDVLIYENVDIIANELKKHNFMITSFNDLNYVFGFSYIKNSASFLELNKNLFQLVIMGERVLEPMIGSMPHEMRLMQYVNQNNGGKYIEVLPVLPTDLNFSEFNYCFDPSSYGQFLGGLAPEKDKYIGSKIIENKIKVIFDNRKPYVIIDNVRYNIFNLHVHNKQLHNFL